MEQKKAEDWVNFYINHFKLDGWKFSWNNAKTICGLCKYKTKEIQLSKNLILLNDNEDEIKNIILHEIAHALVPKGNGHNFVWRIKCHEIGCKAEVHASKVIMPERVKRLYQCPKCKKTIGYHKRVRVNRACKDCCVKYNFGRFTKEFLFEEVK